eukprot:TRINITY_DN12973_c0_g3_i1.p2 TRINITY_DN12973_c0_g3~~TRINITY_DN12973_c0_g3_i1.p2  ORF type:complete len:127 (+),score=25.89 TRINITY_DN12973_c0_g3_i1:360-740(+)
MDSGSVPPQPRDPAKNQREYKGVILYADGSIFDGNIHNNQPNGKGRKFFSDHSYYVGAFVNGEIHGKGKMSSPTGTIYDGDWVKGLKEGEGVETREDEVYEGKFKDGKRNGTVSYTHLTLPTICSV